MMRRLLLGARFLGLFLVRRLVRWRVRLVLPPVLWWVVWPVVLGLG